jgi:hypothetical protein
MCGRLGVLCLSVRRGGDLGVTSITSGAFRVPLLSVSLPTLSSPFLSLLYFLSSSSSYSYSRLLLACRAIMFHIGIAVQHPPLPEPHQLSELGIDFIRQCLVIDPDKRPSAEELMLHPWIQEATAQISAAYEEESAPTSSFRSSAGTSSGSWGGQGTGTEESSVQGTGTIVEEEEEEEGGEYQGEYAEGEYAEGEYAEGEYAEGEYAEGEYAEGEYVEGEYAEGEYAEGGEYEEGQYEAQEGGGEATATSSHGGELQPLEEEPEEE